MAELVTHYAQLRDRIRLGSISIPREEYSFAAFSIGYLAAATALPIELLFQFMESITDLQSSRILSQPNVKQMIKLLLDFPSQAQKIVKTLKSFQNGGQLDFIAFIEGHYHDQPRSHISRKQQVQDELPPRLADNNNDGTLELEDLLRNDTESLNADALAKADADQEKRRREAEAQDIEMARKMQEEFNKEGAGDEEEIMCQVCYVNLFEGTVETLDCGHIFHKDCLAEYFRSSISNKVFPLRCPTEGCQAQTRQSDLRAILSRQMMEKYQQHTLKAYAEEHGDSISWCPTANCGYMFFHEKDDAERFECLQCKKEYCLNCRVEWHKDMTCKEYKISATTSEDDQKFMAFVKGKKFKQCPKCKFWVQKNEGCDHMTCKCKFQFCYKCGGVYMKCECVEKQKLEMENRRRMLEERRQKKEQRKRQAQARVEKKMAEQRAREEQKRQRDQRGTRSRRRK